MQEKIHRAGMVPYRINPHTSQIEMMFMIPSDTKYGGPDPQIAKGRIDPGETAEQAAIREAREELGLYAGQIDGDVHEVGVFMGRTTIFTCKVPYDAMFALTDAETADTRWMTLSDFMLGGRELHRPVIQHCYKLIEKL